MDQEYRKSRIDAMLGQLHTDQNEAENRFKTHKSKGAALDKTGYALTAATMLTGMSVLTTIASPPVGITFGIIAGICGIVDLIVKTIHKKNTIKTQKWRAMTELIQDTHSKIGILVSDTLDDNIISDVELRDVTTTYDTYRKKLTTLRNDYMNMEKNIRLNKWVHIYNNDLL